MRANGIAQQQQQDGTSRHKVAQTSKRYDRLSNQVANNINNQLGILQNHYDKYNIDSLSKDNLKGLTAA